MMVITEDARKRTKELAAGYGVSHEAVLTLFDALIAGHGTMAQFSHPELGGMGQWTRGGMIMIGDLFNSALRAKVNDLCRELADLVQQQPNETELEDTSFQSQWQHGARTHGPERLATLHKGRPASNWWSAELGTPSSTGSQGNIRYAYFPAARRLAVATGDEITLYDTGEHDINGFSQQQSSGSTLMFASQLGLVPLSSFPVVSTGPSNEAEVKADALTASHGKETQTSAHGFGGDAAEDAIVKIERFAELRKKGALSEEEFAAKKAELLARL